MAASVADACVVVKVGPFFALSHQVASKFGLDTIGKMAHKYSYTYTI